MVPWQRLSFCLLPLKITLFEPFDFLPFLLYLLILSFLVGSTLFQNKHTGYSLLDLKMETDLVVSVNAQGQQWFRGNGCETLSFLPLLAVERLSRRKNRQSLAGHFAVPNRRLAHGLIAIFAGLIARAEIFFASFRRGTLRLLLPCDESRYSVEKTFAQKLRRSWRT